MAREVRVFESPLGWRYQILLAGHVIREDGNYGDEGDARWSADEFLRNGRHLQVVESDEQPMRKAQ
jgi:hypothetical protein